MDTARFFNLDALLSSSSCFSLLKVSRYCGILRLGQNSAQRFGILLFPPKRFLMEREPIDMMLLENGSGTNGMARSLGVTLQDCKILVLGYYH